MAYVTILSLQANNYQWNFLCSIPIHSPHCLTSSHAPRLMPFWTDQQLFGDLIKSVVFEQNLLGPKDYDKQRIAALKKSVSIFSAVDNNLFFTMFR